MNNFVTMASYKSEGNDPLRGLELGRGWNKGLKGYLNGRRCNKCGRVIGIKEHKCPTEGPWNKGLTKNDDPRIMHVSQALTGIKRRPESIEKSRINATKRMLEQYKNGERKWWGYNPKNRKSLERSFRKGLGSKESRKKAFEALRKKPTRPEKFLIELLDKYFKNEYKFTGDGKMMINRKFPDFANVNGQKKVILFNGLFWHLKHKKWQGKTREEIETIERKPYEEFGYNVLHIWEDEIIKKYITRKNEKGKAYSFPLFFEDQSKVIEKIRTFNNL